MLEGLSKQSHQAALRIAQGTVSTGDSMYSLNTTLNVCNEIDYVVDINPHRQGTFMAKTGQKIVSPEFLKDYQPNKVIVMNAIYKNEIRQNLQEMGLSPEILTL